MTNENAIDLDFNLQNKIVNWYYLQNFHNWKKNNHQYNLYLFGEDLFYLKICEFISYYFNSNISNFILKN
jgi:hypothetical protein